MRYKCHVICAFGVKYPHAVKNSGTSIIANEGLQGRQYTYALSDLVNFLKVLAVPGSGSLLLGTAGTRAGYRCMWSLNRMNKGEKKAGEQGVIGNY